MPLVVTNVPSSCAVFRKCGSGMLRNTDTVIHVVHVCQTANCTIPGLSASESGSVHLLM